MSLDGAKQRSANSLFTPSPYFKEAGSHGRCIWLAKSRAELFNHFRHMKKISQYSVGETQRLLPDFLTEKCNHP